ncbi:hypothetical protein NHX12_008709 [Muraenolepis orangiensis]|uniref:Uncharacterized protein n=1 Tax=Muraenolepis orangiensis TaxID=630683 RepID=A0A9Q0DL96_9TELE|nr:hypothetical protein NHX12_008709 [Muraenolepis orangiensis]
MSKEGLVRRAEVVQHMRTAQSLELADPINSLDEEAAVEIRKTATRLPQLLCSIPAQDAVGNAEEVPQPCLSATDTVWMEGNLFAVEEVEEVTSPLDNVTDPEGNGTEVPQACLSATDTVWMEGNLFAVEEVEEVTSPLDNVTMAKAILERLVEMEFLDGALWTSPEIFQHFMSYLVAGTVAQLVPDQMTPTQQVTTLEEMVMEERLFSQKLPEPLRPKMFQEFGTWIGHTKLFCKAFPPMYDESIVAYGTIVTRPEGENFAVEDDV